ncbi:MAG: ATP-binding protein [Halothiobacillus sp.]|jgi:two-component system osmolarity sensor histidine kinase EnvZ|nr:ATP-binding protein [Halothiobacillus sp.]
MKRRQSEGHSWSLFSSTALALIGSISVILVFALSAVTWVVMVPMAKRSADDLAALIILSAQTWVELPHNVQPLLAAELKSQHGITIKEITTLTRQHNAHLPYVRFLHDAVVQRFHQCPAGTVDPKTGECIYIGALPNDAGYWLELPIADDVLKFEFTRERVGYKIPFTLGIILVSGILLTLIVGLWLTRRLTRPVSQLAEQVSRGLPDAPLPLTGPKETRVLIDAVNRRTAEVKQLLESRTILLAGISHDLRTPLTRLSLSLALAQDSIEPELHDQMQDDIGRMNRLIAEVLLIARGVNQASTERIALSPWLEQLAENACQRGVELELILPRHEREANIAPMALQRILDNLIDNAHRYGAPPVVLRLVEQPDALVLCVEDQGEGLTESEIEQLMAPFARKDAARGGDAGYGLGLSLASALAESQHWRLELYASGRHPERAPAHRPTGLVACLILPNVVAERNGVIHV